MKRIVIGRPVVEWVAKKTDDFGDFGSTAGIGLEQDGRLIAGVAYCQYNGPNIVCHIASDGTRRWANREFLWTIFDYPFNQAKVKRITVCIGQGNAASIKFVEHLGFQFETFLGDDSHPSGKTLIYFMRKHQCRFLEWKEVNAKRNLQKDRRAQTETQRAPQEEPNREIRALG